MESEKQPRASPSPSVCYYCQEEGHIERFCPKKRASRSQERSEPQCFYCKEIGHTKRNCPKLAHKSERSYAEREGGGASGVQCYYCLEPGHVKRNCPKLQHSGGNGDGVSMEQSSSSGGDWGWRSVPQSMCYHCNQLGHVRRNCPELSSGPEGESSTDQAVNGVVSRGDKISSQSNHTTCMEDSDLTFSLTGEESRTRCSDADYEDSSRDPTQLEKASRSWGSRDELESLDQVASDTSWESKQQPEKTDASSESRNEQESSTDEPERGNRRWESRDQRERGGRRRWESRSQSEGGKGSSESKDLPERGGRRWESKDQSRRGGRRNHSEDSSRGWESRDHSEGTRRGWESKNRGRGRGWRNEFEDGNGRWKSRDQSERSGRRHELKSQSDDVFESWESRDHSERGSRRWELKDQSQRGGRRWESRGQSWDQSQRGGRRPPWDQGGRRWESRDQSQRGGVRGWNRGRGGRRGDSRGQYERSDRRREPGDQSERIWGSQGGQDSDHSENDRESRDGEGPSRRWESRDQPEKNGESQDSDPSERTGSSSEWKDERKEQSERDSESHDRPREPFPPFVDTHCHLEYVFERYNHRGRFTSFTRDWNYADNFDSCISSFCDPAAFSSFAVWRDLLDEPNSKVWGAFGIHPHSAKYYFDETLGLEEKVLRCLEHERCVAFGEIGLDYGPRSDPSEHETQRKVLARQLQLGVTYMKPFVLHCRSAEKDLFEILTQHVPSDWKIHLHCFTGKLHDARLFLEHYPNLYIGITGIVTYEGASNVRTIARTVPLERLLVETDAPYHTPRNLPRAAQCKFSHPAHAFYVAKAIAFLKRVHLGEVLQQVRDNTRAVYGV